MRFHIQNYFLRGGVHHESEKEQAEREHETEQENEEDEDKDEEEENEEEDGSIELGATDRRGYKDTGSVT